jgi:hypothetical protein
MHHRKEINRRRFKSSNPIARRIRIYAITKTPRLMALIAGEVIHVVKCIPVQIKVRHTTECYSELPVWQGNRTASKLWTGPMEFGTVSAAIFGILVTFKLIKIVDIAIHGKQLSETYGCGIALLGAICGTVTHLLLYFKRGRIVDDQTAQPQGILITSTVTQ